ncbi:R-phenyllactate dehydratase small subunit [Candidatus Magnetomorum sp. HK-1]|nr:R-phenyllactate dehydratase small subunit [Candidatus Magnetomorum sp. HK-1]
MEQQDLKSIICKQKAQGKPVIGCFPLYPPVELFASMGIHPIVLWNLKSSILNLTESDRHVQEYACAIGRELVQFVLSESGKLLDGIFSYNACDTLRNIPEIISYANTDVGCDIPMLRIHVPQVNREYCQPEKYLKNEILQLVENLEKVFTLKFSPEKFFQTTEAYTKMRNLCCKAEQLVSQGELSFSLFSEVVILCHFLPVEESIEKLKHLIDKAKKISSDQVINILISGIMPPPQAVIKVMEKAGLRVVANDIGSLSRTYAYSPNPGDDPCTYYEDFSANRFPCTTLLYQSDARVSSFLRILANSKAQGVIFTGEKFCEYEYFEFPYIEKHLKEKGIPSLLLEFSVDEIQSSGAFVTRVQAFKEMLNK